MPLLESRKYSGKETVLAHRGRLKSAAPRGRRAIALSVFLLWPGVAVAHDTWVITDGNHVAVAEKVLASLRTGEAFPRGESPTQPDRVSEWIAVGSQGRTKFSGFAVESNDLAAQVSLTTPGTYVIAVELRPKFIELKAPAFEDYLREEKAEKALEARQAERAPDQSGRELYRKLAKTFVQAGEASKDETFAQPVGHPLEIVPLVNPVEWRAGDQVPVRVLLLGKPAEGLRVSTTREGLPAHMYVQHATTDSEGLAQVRLPRPGLWMIRTHAIRPTPGMIFEDTTQSTAVDWESYFASMTVRVQPKETP